jgi:hypothetical protein
MVPARSSLSSTSRTLTSTRCRWIRWSTRWTGLAEFIAVRDRHPVNPTAGPTSAAAADLDHTISVRTGGTSTRDNLASLVRYWHRLKTFGGWTVTRHHRGWQWTSPRGHTYQTQPYDYRLGP